MGYAESMSDTLTVELPDGLARDVERLARERGMTPEEFLARAAADKVGAAVDAAAFFSARAARADVGAAERFFGRDGGEPPRAGDEAD